MSWRRALAMGLLLASAWLAACGKPDPIARIVEADGGVERTPTSKPPGWTSAAVGDRLVRGAGVRTGAVARARLDVRGGGTLRMGPNSVVWLGANPDAPELVQLDAGDAEIEAGGTEVLIGTAGGRARIRPGARVRVQRGAAGTQLVVEVGAALIERGDEAPVEIAAGGRADLNERRTRAAIDAAMAPVETADAGLADAGADLATAPGQTADIDETQVQTSVALPGGSLKLDPQPTSSDVALNTGESATIHDAAPPTHVRIQLGTTCPGPALVEVKNGRSRMRVLGSKSAVVSVIPGASTYSVRCRRGDGFDNRAASRGAIRVVKDAGKRSVDAAAPKNIIEADGRSYKVLYQNRRPVLVVRWPDAPRAGGYTLTFQSGGKVRRFPSAKAEVVLPSGTVDEGVHSLWFAATGSARRSPDTRLVLDFDNAAPVAQLKDPATPASWSAGSVPIAGVATEGSAVSVAGVELPLDAHFRFNGLVAVAPDQQALAVRIAQRGGRVHYFIRRRP